MAVTSGAVSRRLPAPVRIPSLPSSSPSLNGLPPPHLRHLEALPASEARGHGLRSTDSHLAAAPALDRVGKNQGGGGGRPPTRRRSSRGGGRRSPPAIRPAASAGQHWVAPVLRSKPQAGSSAAPRRNPSGARGREPNRGQSSSPSSSPGDAAASRKRSC